MLGLRFCARASSSCGKWGPLSSRCAGLSLSRPLLLRSAGSRRAGSVTVAHGPSCSAACGNLPRPGLNPVSPALAGRFSTTAPPGKPCIAFFNHGCSVRFSIWSPGEQYPNEARGVPLLQPRLLWSCSPPCPLLFLLTSPLPTPYPHL